MKGDFSRFLFNPKKHFTRVLKQQGRVELDSDWNEQAEINEEQLRSYSRDMLGNCATPKEPAMRDSGNAQSGFELVAAINNGKQDIDIAPGHIYVDGILCSCLNDQKETYLGQPFLPNPPDIQPREMQNDLVYLDVWDRLITSVEDDSIRETALGGPDTTTRVKTIWQLKTQKYTGNVEKIDPRKKAALAKSCLKTIKDRRMSGARLSVNVVAAGDGTDLCEYSPFEPLWLGNRLHRIEIHFGGEILSQDGQVPNEATSGQPVFSLKSKSDLQAILNKTFDAYEEPWDEGQPVLLMPVIGGAAHSTSLPMNITKVEQSAGILTLTLQTLTAERGSDLAAVLIRSNQFLLIRLATFKWSRDNGSLVYNAETTSSKNKLKILPHVSSRGLSLKGGDLVEILTEERELKGRPGILARIQADGVDQENLEVTLYSDIHLSASEMSSITEIIRIRRWDIPQDMLTGEGEANLLVSPNSLRLEGDLWASFSGKKLVCGDYWCFEVRGNVLAEEAKQNRAPMGICHHYAVMGFLEWDGNKNGIFISLRPKFPALTEIFASDILIAEQSRGCSYPADVCNVQQAIEFLCGNNLSICTIIVNNQDSELDWEGALRRRIAGLKALNLWNAARICFYPGTYSLNNPLEFRDMTYISIFGAGPGTIISAKGSNSAITFVNCGTAEVSKIRATSGENASGSGLNGSLTFLNCRRISVRKVELTCESGFHKARSCLAIKAEVVPAEWAIVEDCKMEVGTFQIGVLLVNIKRILVQNNEIALTSSAGETLNAEEAVKDDKLRMMLDRSIMRSAQVMTVAKAANSAMPLDVSKPAARPGSASRSILTRKKAINYEIASGNRKLVFETDKWFKDDLTRIMEPEVIGDKSVKDIIITARARINRALKERSIKPVFERADILLPSLAFQGIVVGGQTAREVRILNNTVSGFLQGIHVGLSHFTTSPTDIDIASQVQIAGNRIEVILPFIEVDRHGIFVGNDENLIIRDNRIIVKRAYSSGIIEGIRVFGRLGSMVIIEKNHVSDASIGLHLESIDPSISDPTMWVVQHNIFLRSSKSIFYYPGWIKDIIIGLDYNIPKITS